MGGTIRSATICGLIPLFFILLAQLATAFPCERFGWFSSCDVVMWSGLPEEEKMSVVASMIDDVRSWNTDFEVDEPPEGTNVIDNGIVSNAWIKIMAVMPSIYEENAFLTPGFGEVVAKSNFELHKPSGKEGKDCKTKHKLQHSSQIQQYLNGDQIGIGETAEFNTNDSILNFEAKLTIDTVLTVDHYRLEELNDTYECVYSSTDVRNSQTLVSDAFQAVRYQPNITYSFQIQNQYYDITQVNFNVSNQSWFKLQFNNNFYEKRDTEFERFFTLEPYYILNFKPKKHTTIEFQGVRFQNNTFQTPDISNCKILLGDYFRTYTIPCPSQYKPFILQVFTDKTIYEPGEVIRVSVLPKIPVLLSYGNETIFVQGNAKLRAKLGEHLIIARSQGMEAVRAIYVTNPAAWNSFWSILGFLLISFVFYRVTVRLVGGVYDLWNS